VLGRVALIATALAVTVTVTACSPIAVWRTGHSQASRAPSTITWQNCDKQARELNSGLSKSLSFDCGTVTVPQDWSTAKDGKASDGKTFTIALMRAHSSHQVKNLGSILMDPGGPGASGIELIAGRAPMMTNLLTSFDLIGFDPRGAGQSNPVDCVSDADLDASFAYEPDPATGASFDGAVTLAQRIADGCQTKYGAQLRLFATEQAARDMDAIRAALGEPKLNYLGFSYGTLLGAVYAELFGANIRAMVLDGAVDPGQDSTGGSEGQAIGFERAFSDFATWCEHNTGSCPIAPDARAAVTAAIASARTSPVKGVGGRQASSGLVFLAVIQAMYGRDLWPYLAKGIDDLRTGDPRLVLALADEYSGRDRSGHYSNLVDAFNAISCVDAISPTVDKIRALQSKWRTKYPLFGAPLAVGLLSCAVWPVTRDPYPVGPAKGAPPIVVVGTTGDPATPYESTARLATMLGTGVVVTREGEGHTGYFDSTCIHKAVDNYLIELTVPEKDLTCPA
jgi:pimeloyl-ACP methyl ester carboxylesterase